MEQTMTRLEKVQSVIEAMNYRFNNQNDELDIKSMPPVDSALCQLFNEQEHTNEEIIDMSLWASLSKENCLDLLITNTLEKEHSMMK